MRFHSLRFRFLISSILLLSVFFVLASYNLDLILKSAATEHLHAAIRQTSQTLGFAVVTHATDEGMETLTPYLDQLVNGEDQGIVYIAVLDEQGQVLTKTSGTPDSLPAATDAAAARLDDDVIHVTQPIPVLKDQAGTLRIGFSAVLLHRVNAHILRENLFIFAIGAAVTLFLLALAGKRLNDRLLRLSDVSRALAMGDFGVYADESGQDELATLARNFNRMAVSVAERTDALTLSEARFRRLFDECPDPCWIIDESNLFELCNDAAAHLLGYQSGEELKSVHPSVISPERQTDGRESREKADEMIALAHRHGVHRFEWVHRRKNGDCIPMEITLARLASGNRFILYCVGRDISSRKVAEAQITRDHEQQAALRRLLELVLADGPLADTLHRCLEHLLSVSWLAILPKGGIFLNGAKDDGLRLVASFNLSPEIHALCAQVPLGRCYCGRAAATGELQYADHVDDRHEITYPLMADHGHYSVPLMSGTDMLGVLLLYLPPMTARDLQQEEFISAAADVLANYLRRKRTEQSLIEHQSRLDDLVRLRTADLAVSEAHSRAILKTMVDAVVHMDSRGIVLSVNDAVSAIFGYTSAELVGRNITVLMTDPHRSKHDQYLARYLESEGMSVLGRRLEVDGLHKDGHVIALEVAVTEMADETGRTFIGVIRDVSARKQTERELRMALQRAEVAVETRSRFLANMSHEIRTPLNAVLGLARIGQRDNAGRETQDVFRRITDSGKHLLGVINDILDFSKIEAGKMMIDVLPFQIRHTVKDAVSFVSQRASDKGLLLTVSIASDIPDWLAGDTLRIRQVLVNLLSNAVKFTDHGEISLSLTRQGEICIFRVIDTGIGLADDQLQRLFAPFEQADGAITRKYGGTGLGLAISRHLAVMMGGEIQVESRIDVGSIFKFRVPLAEVCPIDQLTGLAPPVGGLRLTGIRVLAAEDIEVNRLVLEDLLVTEGAAVTFAEHGLQAVERVKADGPAAFDIVLMDVQMPVMDGREASRQIRGIEPKLPIIALTAHAMAEERELCRAAGMVEHVAKPIDPDTLVATILKVIDSSHLPMPSLARKRRDITPAPADSGKSSDSAWPSVRRGAESVVDWPVLIDRYKESPGFVAKLVATACRTQAEVPVRLRAAAGAGDFQDLAFLAHGLKSVAGNMEAQALRESAYQLERSARAGEEGAIALAESVAVAADAFLQALQEADLTAV